MARAEGQDSIQSIEHLKLYQPPLCPLSRFPSFLSLFLLGPVGVMRLALLPFRVVMRIK